MNARDALNMFNSADGQIDLGIDSELLRETCISSEIKMQKYLSEEFLDWKGKMEIQISHLDRLLEESKQHTQVLTEQLTLAYNETLAAKQDAALSKRQSKKANILAVIAIIVAISAWLIPSEAIRELIVTFFLQ